MSDARPSLDLNVELTNADGVVFPLYARAPRAGDRPTGMSFATKQSEGFSDGAFTLARDPAIAWPDLALVNGVAFLSPAGETAYEGRVNGLPRSIGEGKQIQVVSLGWMDHARDKPCAQIFADADLSQWQQMPRDLQVARLLASQNVQNQATTAADPDSGLPTVITQLTGPWSALVQVCDAFYDAGPGLAIGAVYYDLVQLTGGAVGAVATDPNWALKVIFAQKSTLTLSGGQIDSSANLAPGPSHNYVTTTKTDRRYAVLESSYAAIANGANGIVYPANWRNVRVYGTHGLPLIGTTDPKGLAASDVITWVAENYCPLLDPSGVQRTTYPIQHLVFRDLTDPLDIWLQVNAFHLWQIGVWENRQLVFAAGDLTKSDWTVRYDDPGVKVDEQGDNSDSLANGICVDFTDLGGTKQRLTPDNTSALADTNPDNPWTLHGIDHWMKLTIGAPMHPADAVTLGAAVLAQNNTPKNPGTITVSSGYVRDPAGNWQQGWKVRAGQTVSVTNYQVDQPRIVTETRWDQDSKTLTISVDGTFKRVEAILDRLNAEVTAAGLPTS